MMNLRIVTLGVVVVAGALLGAGCSSDSKGTDVSSTDLKGQVGAPMTDDQKKAAATFQEEFKKKHPQTGGPGVPPPGQ